MAFKWNDELSTGVDIIDEQHQEIIRRMNLLLAAMRGGHGRLHIRRRFEDSEQYMREHFALEEFYMKKHGYLRLDEHRKEHSAFLARVDRWKARVGQGLSAHEVIQISESMTGWLRHHVMETDSRMGAHLLKVAWRPEADLPGPEAFRVG